MARRTNILVVEDDPNDALLIHMALRKTLPGVLIVVVPNGIDAVEYLKGSERYADHSVYPFPDFVLLDLKMPLMNGFEVLSWIREQPNLRGVPVVILSNLDNRPDINRATHLGANSYLVKPANFNGLVSMMATIKQMLDAVERHTEPALRR